MKTLPSLLLSLALACVTATTASAYSFSPPFIRAKLKGMITFTPNEGGHPFTCKVVLDLKTTKSVITTVNFPQGCSNAISFLGLPWGVGILSANSGEFAFRGFDSTAGNCEGFSINFQDNKRGVWTLPAGQCLSGTLRSQPPVTIVP